MDLDKDKTMLNENFLRYSAGFSLDELTKVQMKTTFRNYYDIICNAVNQLHFKKPTPTQIEAFLVGRSPFGGSPLPTEKERKYHFLMAQAKQLYHDINESRLALQQTPIPKNRIKKLQSLLSEDAEAYLNMLGLVNNGTMFKGY